MQHYASFTKCARDEGRERDGQGKKWRRERDNEKEPESECNTLR